MDTVTSRTDAPSTTPSVAGGGLRFEGVSKAFRTPGGGGRFLAVKDLELEVAPGRFVCLIGPSGCGKSTLLNMTAGLMPPSSGRVLYRGVPVTGVNSQVGYITQQDNLLPWRTLAGNVAIALEIRGVPRQEREERVGQILARVGLQDFADHYPSQLSGGMRKRAALARTMIYEPETLLMDEPFGALDAMMRMSLQRELLDIWEREKKTVLFVTHDLEEAILLADEVVVFGTNPGRIVHVETVTLPRPRNLVDMRGTAEFAETWERLWSLIETQLAPATGEGPPRE